MISLRFFEKSLWGIVLLMGAIVWIFTSHRFALAANLGGVMMAAHFSIARYVLGKIISPAAPHRYAYVLLYMFKFFALIGLLAVAVLLWKLPVLGLACGVSSIFFAVPIFFFKEWGNSHTKLLPENN